MAVYPLGNELMVYCEYLIRYTHILVCLSCFERLADLWYVELKFPAINLAINLASDVHTTGCVNTSSLLL